MNASDPLPIGTKVVELFGVTKIFRGRRSLRRPFAAVTDRIALRKVDLAVERGELVAFIGANGSGKTTLLRLVAGLLTPNAGEVRRRTAKFNHATSNERQFYERLTGFENLRFFARLAGIDPAGIEPACAMLGLKARDVREPVWTYSTGMKVRLSMARAFMGAPEMILLDEPTRSMDAAGCDDVQRAIRAVRDERGAAFLVATHDPELIAACDRYVVLVDGAVAVSGRVENLEQIRRLRAAGFPRMSGNEDRPA